MFSEFSEFSFFFGFSIGGVREFTLIKPFVLGAGWQMVLAIDDKNVAIEYYPFDMDNQTKWGLVKKEKKKDKEGEYDKGEVGKKKRNARQEMKEEEKEYEECGKGIDGIDRQLASFLQEINMIRVTSLIFFPLLKKRKKKSCLLKKIPLTVSFSTSTSSVRSIKLINGVLISKLCRGLYGLVEDAP